MPTTRMNEAQNPTSLKERGDKSPNRPRLSWLLTPNHQRRDKDLDAGTNDGEASDNCHRVRGTEDQDALVCNRLATTKDW